MVFSMHVAMPDTANAATSVTPMVAAGNSHSLALKSDGTVWAWGSNSSGQLGNGTSGTNKSSAAKISNLDNVTIIAGGYSYSLALKGDGTVWAWGYNAYGQLGNGTTGTAINPVQVSNLTGVTAIAGGGFHSLALKSDGTVWAWGRNNSGQLGNGSSGTGKDESSPVQVTGISGVIAIAAGYYHSLALKNDGTVWAWGRNNYGQLGIESDAYDSNSPVQVSGLTQMIAIAGGYEHSLALKNDGTVLAWGNNLHGQLGVGTSGVGVNKKAPVQTIGLSGVTAIAGGYYHSLALKSDSTVQAWGSNSIGELGIGNTEAAISKPTQIIGLSGVISIAGGNGHSVALNSDGTVRALGSNTNGQLGDDSTTDKTSPVQVKGEGGSGNLSLGATYKVTLNSNGGNNGTPLVWVAPGAVMPRIMPPKRPGCVFGGYWNTSASSGGKQYYKPTGFSANDWDSIGDATLWARWTAVNSGGVNGGNKTGSSSKVKAVKTLQAIYIVKGKSVTLPAAVQPYNAANKKVAFKSKDKKIAKVTSAGKIKGLKTGKTTITITTKDGNKKATCKVYVVKKAVKLKKLTLNQKAKITLTKGKTLEVKAKLNPKKATGIVPKFTSKDKSVAVIDKAGTITALKAGSTTITVKAGKLKKTIKLTVK